MSRPLASTTSVTLLATVVATITLVVTPAHGVRSLRPCAYEDGPGPCVWDAKHRGNGLGHSFILRRDGRIHYINHRRAHRISQ